MTNPLGVIPDDLDKYAATLHDRTTEAQGAVAYCKEWLSPPPLPFGFYGHAAAAVDRIGAELVANYERLAALADGSMAELVATARQYRDMDEASATGISQAGE